MSIPLILIVTAIYAGVSFSELRAGRHGMALMFAAYAMANVGLIWSIKSAA